jgi:hypothetical protein
MKSKSILFLLLLALLAVACKKSATIALDTPSGSPGDIVTLRVTHGVFPKTPSVKIAAESAVVISSSDTAVSIMIPALAPQSTKISVDIEGKPLSATFEVQPPDAERLWFTLKGNAVAFTERQPSREDFVRDKSHTMNKLLLEFLNTKGEVIALVYIDHPGVMEVPSPDGKGFSMVERKDEVAFSANIPVLTDLAKVRVSTITPATKGKATLMTELAIPAK